MDYLVLLWLFMDTSGVSEVRMFTNDNQGYSSSVCEQSLDSLQKLLESTPKDAILVERTMQTQAFACEYVTEYELLDTRLYTQNETYYLGKYNIE